PIAVMVPMTAKRGQGLIIRQGLEKPASRTEVATGRRQPRNGFAASAAAGAPVGAGFLATRGTATPHINMPWVVALGAVTTSFPTAALIRISISSDNHRASYET